MGLNTTAATVVPGQTGTAALWNVEVRDAINGIQAVWTAWTPTFSSGLTVGNGTLTGSYLQVGKKVTCRMAFTFGSTSAVTAPRLQFPVAISSTYAVNHALAGSAFFFDTSATGRFAGLAMVNDTTTSSVGTVYFLNINTGTTVAAAVPMTWATGDLLTCSFTYEAA